MRIPEQVHCDFCNQVIDRSQPWPTLSYPLTTPQRESLAPTDRGPVIGLLGLYAPIDLVPRSIVLEVCRGCLDGLLPLVSQVAAQRVSEALAAKALRAAVVGSHEHE